LAAATIFTVAANTPASATKITKPGRPTSLTALAVDTALIVSWSPPESDGGSPLTGYLVTVQRQQVCMTTTATTCTVTGLENGHTYLVKVHALNAEGTGPAATKRARPTGSQDCSYLGPWANLQECDLPGVNLTGVNLTGADLTDAYLAGADFAHSNLTNANLTGADLYGGVTSGGIIGTPAELPGPWAIANGYLIGPNADLTGADLAGTNLDDDSLNDAIVTGSNLTGANMSTTYLVGITSGGIIGIPASLPSGWSLVDGYFIGAYAQLIDADLSGANLASAFMGEANLNGADLADADMQGTELGGADLTSADLDGADMAGALGLGAVVWSNTTCPDGTNSNNDSGTCINNLG
jgi:uncharacterized protein YjbI with pentapeptide repeats